ncbi:hypothetical protein Syun_016345 [Stephania yunnanensis]|uniref:Uncharacterized protein n=1 Tax=Stephania yunnanensis TaxID=152371 RepID=A0AAP0J734_9MAGN
MPSEKEMRSKRNIRNYSWRSSYFYSSSNNNINNNYYKQQQQQQQQQQQEQEQQQQLQLQQQPQTQQTTLFSGVTSIEDEPCRRGDSNTGLSSSDCEESIVSSPVIEAMQSSLTLPLAPEKPLPEKGKFLQAVMKAGPLLQTLLLAGPLPQWRHPPPQLDSIEIPPVAIPSPLPQLLRQDSSLTYLNNDNCGHSNQRKRSLITNEGSDSFNNTKYQRIVLH